MNARTAIDTDFSLPDTAQGKVPVKTTYQSLLKALESASGGLPKVDAPVLPGDISSWVEKLPFIDICTGDDVCREFSATRRWPKMPDQLLAQIHLRVDFALDLARNMIQQGRTNVKPPELLTDALDLALVEFWHDKGIEWARFRFGYSPEADALRQKN